MKKKMMMVVAMAALMISAQSFASKQVSAYNTTQRDEVVRKGTSRNQVSLGAPSPTTGLSWTGGATNKIVVTVAPSYAPIGFDLYVTPQGAAIRFVGADGDPDGTDSGTFLINTSFSISVGTGSGECFFQAKTRQYDEPDFANATDIQYVSCERNFSNNDLGNISFAPQLISLSDGDLIEFAAIPDTGFSSVSITSAGVVIAEI